MLAALHGSAHSLPALCLPRDRVLVCRSQLGSDPGSMERESALLAMLVQMDGIHGKLEQVRD